MKLQYIAFAFVTALCMSALWGLPPPVDQTAAASTQIDEPVQIKCLAADFDTAVIHFEGRMPILKPGRTGPRKHSIHFTPDRQEVGVLYTGIEPV